MITKILFSGAMALGATLGLAVPAGADPSVFNDLSWSCAQTVSNGGPSVVDQMQRGIRAGLTGIEVRKAEQ